MGKTLGCEVESLIPGATTVQNFLQFIQCLGSIRSQGNRDIFPKPQLTARLPVRIHGEQISHDMLLPRGFDKLGRDCNFVVVAGEPFLRERRKQGKESIDVQHRQRPAAAAVRLKDLEGEESGWLLFIAAVGVPFKSEHCL